MPLTLDPLNNKHINYVQTITPRTSRSLVSCDEPWERKRANFLFAGIAHDLKEFTWSSHQGYLSEARKWQWLYKKFLLDTLRIR
jgi:hypothetical protein